ncbi:MAG: PspC domain-containing protein [Sphaerochaetaceae bacterium]|nr:PspC domain-containing protein [Sphaerochaetaceae bacterium]MDX9939371.1 PspC domain-containing protein [Sphaerochaetaceae bacterium]
MDSRYEERYRQYMKSEYRKGYDDGWFDAEPRRPLRRSRNGILLGVCQGFADWLAIPAWPLRVATIIAFIATGFWPVGALYLAAALIMKPASR